MDECGVARKKFGEAENTSTSMFAGNASVNDAGFVDVPCVRYYRTIREAAGPDARQIGYGVNKEPPAPVVRRWITELHTSFLRHRVTDYDVPESVRERRLLARLAGRYLGEPGIKPEHVVLCNGSSEALSVIFGWAARRKLRAVLPLPLYFGFEQSAARHGVPVTAYYNAMGEHVEVGSSGGNGTLLVDIAPNGVFGTWPERIGGLAPDLLVVDHVFALPTFQPKAAFLARLRSRIGDLRRAAVLCTPSKDLSLPGLRCGLMITANRELLRYAHDDRFERGYAVHGATARVAAAHLASLLIAFAAKRELPELCARLSAEFGEAEFPFLSDVDVAEFRDHIREQEDSFTARAALIDRSEFLAPVPGLGPQDAGYSGFRCLRGPFSTPDALTAWVREAGGDGLKLNPNYLFGADPVVWERLYPGVLGVRVNFSVPLAQLVRDLALLRELVLK